MLQSMGQQDYYIPSGFLTGTGALKFKEALVSAQKNCLLKTDLVQPEMPVDFHVCLGRYTKMGGKLSVGYNLLEICDPRISTGPLQCCPFTGTDPCSSSNPDWPTVQQVMSLML